jgi:hypothetical protein
MLQRVIVPHVAWCRRASWTRYASGIKKIHPMRTRQQWSSQSAVVRIQIKQNPQPFLVKDVEWVRQSSLTDADRSSAAGAVLRVQLGAAGKCASWSASGVNN